MSRGGLLRGHIHLHGAAVGLPLQELANAYRERGLDFLILTEHPEDVGADGFERMRDEAMSASDGSFLVSVGLEGATSDGPHLMSLGVEQFLGLGALSWEAAVFATREQGGVAILAHPTADEIRLVHRLGVLPDVVEVWNGLRAGWAPDPSVLTTLRELGGPWDRIPGCGGPDAHRLSQAFKVRLDVNVRTRTIKELLDGIRAGQFRMVRGAVAADPWSRRSPLPHRVLYHLSLSARRAMGVAAVLARRTGVPVGSRLRGVLERWA